MNNDKKKLLVAAGALALLFIAVLFLHAGVNGALKRLALMESVYAEMSGNRAGLISMSEETKALKARVEESKNKNFVSETEKIATECGLSKNLKKIHFITHREDARFKGDDYELKIEGVDINTSVNFIYRILNAGVLVKVKKCSIAVSFENPTLLNISLLVSHIT
ncbi:MAG: hypothetical protein HZB31_00475 [Nitrospirae bacterium]|nr:hypothetical protein [Nitrospirota bacterium]